MRYFITLPFCPGCKDIHAAVEMFNRGKPPKDQIITHYYFSPPTRKIEYLIKKIYTKEDIENGLGPPLIIFDGVVLRRRDYWDGMDHPEEIAAMLETMHKNSSF